jgi:hypothetical protein
VEIDEPSYLARSELIASVDRLLYELFTGDSSHRPVRLWKLWQLHDSLKVNDWPYIDPAMMNTRTLAFEVLGWPLTQFAHQPYFVQIAGVHYHYGMRTANIRQFQLSAFITPFHGHNLYRGCIASVQSIVSTILVPELHLFLKNGFTRMVQKQSCIPELSVSMAMSLKRMSNQVDGWGGPYPLSSRYDPYDTGDISLNVG